MAKRRSARQISASRANFRKAALVSAAKRRGRRRKVVAGILAGSVVVGAVGGTLVAHRYASALKSGPKRAVHHGPLALTAGTGVNTHRIITSRVNLDIGKDTSQRIKSFDETAKKAARSVAIKQQRDKKNQRRRMKYWHAKPVAPAKYVIRRGRRGKKK